MEEKSTMEAVLPTENQEEVSEMMDFLEGLEPENKKEFLAFLQGVKFAKSIDQNVKGHTS